MVLFSLGTAAGPTTRRLDADESVVVHCRQSIGRSAVIAALLLVSAGEKADQAFSRIERARGCLVPDTEEQRAWVKERTSGLWPVEALVPNHHLGPDAADAAEMPKRDADVLVQLVEQPGVLDLVKGLRQVLAQRVVVLAVTEPEGFEAPVEQLAAAVPERAHQRHVAVHVVVVHGLVAALRVVVAQVKRDDQLQLGVIEPQGPIDQVLQSGAVREGRPLDGVEPLVQGHDGGGLGVRWLSVEAPPVFGTCSPGRGQGLLVQSLVRGQVRVLDHHALARRQRSERVVVAIDLREIGREQLPLHRLGQMVLVNVHLVVVTGATSWPRPGFQNEVIRGAHDHIVAHAGDRSCHGRSAATATVRWVRHLEVG
jgi:hypothetical protein